MTIQLSNEGSTISNQPDPTTKLVRFLDLQAEKLKLDLRAARLFVGTTDIGNVAEHALRRFFASLLTQRYRVGVGEAIAPDSSQPAHSVQTQQKDVIIYDPYGSSIFDWNESGVGLFPVECIYAVIEVKTSIRSADQLLQAFDQVLEVKRLCQTNRPSDQKPPFTGVFVFDSRVSGNTLFEPLRTRSPEQRPDFVLILQPNDPAEPGNSQYFAHWHYHSRGGGPIDFTTASETEQESQGPAENRNKFLTFGDTNRALLWFYLFLLEQMDQMRLTRPNLWLYANATPQRLGWRHDES